MNRETNPVTGQTPELPARELGSLVYVESIKELQRDRGWSAGQTAVIARRNVVHEIGHQFNIEDRTGGLYDYNLLYNPAADVSFTPSHLDRIRHTRSPGLDYGP